MNGNLVSKKGGARGLIWAIHLVEDQFQCIEKFEGVFFVKIPWNNFIELFKRSPINSLVMSLKKFKLLKSIMPQCINTSLNLDDFL